MAPPLFAAYDRMLAEPALFSAAVRELRGGGAETHSLRSLLLLLDLVFEVFAEVGLRHLYEVYHAVRRHPSPAFASASCWRVCHVSGATSRRCTQLSESVFVQPQYAKWVSCLWLSTHMLEQERARADALPPAHAETYRRALAFVLAQVRELYAGIGAAQKNKVFAALPPSSGGAS